MIPRGSVDRQRAKKAILDQKSLLPAGVIAVEGNFDLGDCVEIFRSLSRIGGKRNN